MFYWWSIFMTCIGVCFLSLCSLLLLGLDSAVVFLSARGKPIVVTFTLFFEHFGEGKNCWRPFIKKYFGNKETYVTVLVLWHHKKYHLKTFC